MPGNCDIKTYMRSRMRVELSASLPLREAVVNPAPVSDRVYATLRDQISAGQWRPGLRIELALLWDLLDASLSPVRDALHRLRGERLLMDGYGNGFTMPALSEADPTNRYGWLICCCSLALEKEL